MTRTRIEAATRMLGAAALLLLGTVAVMGLVVTPPDQVLGDHVRLLYIHPAVAWVAYLAFGVTSLTSLLYLVPRTRQPRWDHIAAASTEIGVVFIGLALATGSIWGRPTWGSWWEWDARMTTTIMLLLLYLGVLALRNVPAPREVRARRAAVASLFAFLDVPIVHMSVKWWRTLHQEATLVTPDPTLDTSMFWTMILSVAAFSAVYAWLLIVRVRVQRWEDRVADDGLDAAIAERRAEGSPGSSEGTGSSGTSRAPVLEGTR